MGEGSCSQTLRGVLNKRCSTTPSTSGPAFRSSSTVTDWGVPTSTRCGARRSRWSRGDTDCCSAFDALKRGQRCVPAPSTRAWKGLRSTFRLVVADVSGDFEGEADGGSVDVEERNHLSRAAALRSTVVLVVGLPGLKGTHSLANLVRELARSGVPGERILPVLNRSPRHPRARAESARTLATLLTEAGVSTAVAAPLCVPERKLEEHLRSGSPLPAALVDPVVRSVSRSCEQTGGRGPAVGIPGPHSPGVPRLGGLCRRVGASTRNEIGIGSARHGRARSGPAGPRTR